MIQSARRSDDDGISCVYVFHNNSTGTNKDTKSNFIYQGYEQDVTGGFKVTRKGLDFVREYFKN